MNWELTEEILPQVKQVERSLHKFLKMMQDEEELKQMMLVEEHLQQMALVEEDLQQMMLVEELMTRVEIRLK